MSVARRMLASGAALLVIVSSAAVAAAALDRAPVTIHPMVEQQTMDGQTTELIVVLRQQADLAPAANLADKLDKATFVYNALWQTAQDSQQDLRAWLDRQGVSYRPFYIINALLIHGADQQLLQALAARDDIDRIEPNPEVRNQLPVATPDQQGDSPSGIEWGIDRTNAPVLWDLGFTGTGLVVAGADTGIDWDHPALIDQYRGWNGSSADHDYNWHDAIHTTGSSCGADSPEPCDDHGHGTHTVGTVAGDDGGSNQIGMAPGAKWIGCRNMNSGVGTPARYIECMEFFLAPYPVGGTPAQGDPSKAPDVTNNSWGCPPSEGCSWDSLKAAAEAQRAAGIMMVTSAGNDGPSCGSVVDPAAIYDSVYSVGSTTSSNALSGFSSRGPATGNQGNPSLMKPDIVAPGSSIRSAMPGGGYGSMSGTSMAGPHVAGAVALVWDARPDLRSSLTSTEDLINSTATRLTSIVEGCGGDYVDGPNNSWGHGLVDLSSVIDTSINLQPLSFDFTELSGNGNGVVERYEMIRLNPTWKNNSMWPAVDVRGTATASTGVWLVSDDAAYGTIPTGYAYPCEDTGDCYVFKITGSRPGTHWDITIDETVSTTDQNTWSLHVGESFPDVATDHWAYSFIETLLHEGITSGCGSGLYCPLDSVTRWQMAVFLAQSMLGGAVVPTTGTVPDMGDYDCSPGGISVFGDVPADDGGCKFIHYIAAEGITSGCGGGNYCPEWSVDRWQMGVFLAVAMAAGAEIPTSGTVPDLGSYNCVEGGSSVFVDVPPTDAACKHIHYIAANGVTGGCGGGAYCPGDDVTRDQMAVFLTTAFNLELYSQ